LGTAIGLHEYDGKITDYSRLRSMPNFPIKTVR